MENKKDIGKAINDKLSSLEKSPNEQVWGNISYELQKKKKRRFAFFFFWTKIIGFLFVGLIGIIYIYNQNHASTPNPQNNSSKTITVNGSNNKNEDLDNNGKGKIENANTAKGLNTLSSDDSAESENSITKNKSAKNKNSIDLKSTAGNSLSKTNKKSKSSLKNKTTNNTKRLSKLSSKDAKAKIRIKKSKSKKGKSGKSNTIINQKEIVADIDLTSLQGTNDAAKDNEIKIKKTDSISKKEKDLVKNINMYPKEKTEKDSTENFKNYDVDIFVSPTYNGYFSKNSTIDTRLNPNSKQSEIQLSFGGGFSFELNQKISVRIGYSLTKIKFTTKNAMINTLNYKGIEYNQGISNLVIYNNSGNAETMDITQKISYSEIPLEVKYKFFKKKIEADAIAGFSFLYLNQNSVDVKTDSDYSKNIGKTSGLSQTSLSLNIGIGLGYGIFKNTKIIVEPMFNYQLKSFEKGNYKPYTLGIHTGIRYTFTKN